MNMITTSFGPSPTFLSLTDGPPSPAKFFYECERSVSDASIKLARRVPFSPDVFKLIGPTLEDVIGADMRLFAKDHDKQAGRLPITAKIGSTGPTGMTETGRRNLAKVTRALSSDWCGIAELSERSGLTSGTCDYWILPMLDMGLVERKRAKGRSYGGVAYVYRKARP